MPRINFAELSGRKGQGATAHHTATDFQSAMDKASATAHIYNPGAGTLSGHMYRISGFESGVVAHGIRLPMMPQYIRRAVLLRRHTSPLL